MTPKVSVVTPVYNAEKYLEKCLDSVLGQTLSPIEVICVDDGSTDSSPEILARYAAEHANLRVIHQENSGPSVARNAALDAAQGEYILCVDSDDWLLRSDVIESLYGTASSLQLDELFFNAQVSYEDEDTHAKNRRFDRLYERKGKYPDVLSGPEMFEALCSGGDYVCSVWSRLYRRAFLEQNRLRLPTGIIHEDEVFSVMCLSLARRVGYLDLVCYGRYLHPGSLMTSLNLPWSVVSFLKGIQTLEHFARERLSGASSEQMRRYRWRMRVLANMAADQYLSLSRAERAAIFDNFPPRERAHLRLVLLGGILRQRTRKLRKGIGGKR